MHVIHWITIWTQCKNAINYSPGLKDDRHSDGAFAVDILGHHPAVTIDLLQQCLSLSLPHPLLYKTKYEFTFKFFLKISKKLNSYIISQAYIKKKISEWFCLVNFIISDTIDSEGFQKIGPTVCCHACYLVSDAEGTKVRFKVK